MVRLYVFNKDPFTILISTFDDIRLPHYAEMRKHNSEPIFVMPAQKQGSGLETWRNADRVIRNWWRINSNSVKTKNVLILEYDVYINAKINATDGRYESVNINFPDQGVACRDSFNQKQNRTYLFFNEKDRLPIEMQEHMCATAPLAVMLWNRDALDAICDPVFDDLFNLDIFCEMRIGTLLSYLGIKVYHANLPLANYMQREVDEGPGIYHSVKQSVVASDYHSIKSSVVVGG